MRRLLALAAQGVALLDTEAVLLVHHDQAQVVELHLVLDQRVGADHDPGLTGDQVEQRLPPPRRPHGTGEQHDLGGVLGPAEHAALGQLAHHLGDRPVVLLGEHLGRREHRGLPARVDDGEHGAQGDHRLPGTDFPLEQPVHRVLGGEVVEDLLGDLLLALGEGEGQLRVEGGQQPVRLGEPGHGGELGVGVAAAGQGDLEDEGLVPLETGAGVVDVRLGVRAVDLQKGLGEETRPRPSRRESGSGSTASWALSSTVCTDLAIFQDSSLAVAG